jgi:hypothetical protein
MPHIDLASLLAERLLGITLDVFLEAFGVTALITILIRKFTDKIKSHKDTVLFCIIVFLISIITISTFGNQRFRPEINVAIDAIASGNRSADDRDTIVILFSTLVNRGNAPTVIMDYDLLVYMNGQKHKGVPLLIQAPMIAHLGQGKVQTISPEQELFKRPLDRPLQTGVPVQGTVIYTIKNQPSQTFSGTVEYTITLTDSFGYTYSASRETHGEFSLTPSP